MDAENSRRDLTSDYSDEAYILLNPYCKIARGALALLVVSFCLTVTDGVEAIFLDPVTLAVVLLILFITPYARPERLNADEYASQTFRLVLLLAAVSVAFIFCAFKYAGFLSDVLLVKAALVTVAIMCSCLIDLFWFTLIPSARES